MSKLQGKFEPISTFKYPFGTDIVKIEVRAYANIISDEFPLRITATFGELEHDIEHSSLFGKTKSSYRIRIQYCKLTYTLEGCSIPEHTKYTLPIQWGSFSEKAQIHLSNSRNASFSGDITVNTKISPATFGSASFSSSLASKNENENRQLKNIEYSPQINLIEPIPNGWAVGIDGIGDPYRDNMQCCLRSCYFDQLSEKYPASCVVKFDDGVDDALMRFMISARGGLYVEKLDDDGRPSHEVRGRQRVGVLETMRAKIAGIVIEESLNGGVILAEALFRAQKSADSGDIETFEIQEPDQNLSIPFQKPREEQI